LLLESWSTPTSFFRKIFGEDNDELVVEEEGREHEEDQEIDDIEDINEVNVDDVANETTNELVHPKKNLMTFYETSNGVVEAEDHADFRLAEEWIGQPIYDDDVKKIGRSLRVEKNKENQSGSYYNTNKLFSSMQVSSQLKLKKKMQKK